jgi:gluconate 5-dehydrogenase
MSDRARSLAFDVTELDRLPARIQEIEQMCGPVRTLINNAGRHQKKPSLDVADEEFLSVINTNLLATFGLAREVARRLISLKQSGDIQFISSMSALFGLPMVAAYTASKTAICGLVRQLPAEWSELGIRVNGIAPGFIETAMSRKIFDADPSREAKIIDRTPMRRLGTPDEIAGLSLFLASPLASFITGTTIPVDGGASIGF